MLTKNQVKWASQHDWFMSHGIIQTNGTVEWVEVIERTTDVHGLGETLYHTFRDFQELKQWAGY